MAIDTPATIAVIGAGPMGLEATLYARFLGYRVQLYERGRVAERVRQDGGTPLSAPFAMYRSTLGLAALKAQDESYQPPQDDIVLTAADWVAAYLEPLSRTDLLIDGLRERMSVETASLLRTAGPADEADGDKAKDSTDHAFELRVRDIDGQHRPETVDAVIDTSGDNSVDYADKSIAKPDAESDDTKPLEDAGVHCPITNLYILGTAREPGPPADSFVTGLDQIRSLFALIGGRRDLDLYRTIRV